MKKLLVFIATSGTMLSADAFAQNVAINNNGAQAHASAMLDVNSTSKGLLTPRMTTAQRNAIANPAQALLVYDTNIKSFMFFNGTEWTNMGTGGSDGVFMVTNGQVHNTGDINTNNFIFGRTALPQSNEGIEDKFMFFKKDKGAFRAGGISQDEYNWSPDKIGLYSVALGYNNVASATGSASFGHNNIASGIYSTSMGYYTKATGGYSTSMGISTWAAGNASLAAGFGARANGLSSAAFGEWTTAQSYASMAVGRFNDSITNSKPDVWVGGDPLFIIGNGTSNDNRRNALTVLKNGNTGLGTSSPASLFHLKHNSNPGFGHIIVEETGDNSDGGRITYKNSGTGFFWDMYGNPGQNLPDQARFNFNFTNPGQGGISRDVLTLTGIGRVGIGNSNPSASLDLLSNSSVIIPQIRARVNTNDFVRIRMSNTVNSSPFWDVASQTSGITPVNARMNFFYSHTGSGGVDVLSLQGNGNATLLGTLSQNSDERLKKNIEHIENPLELIDQISGYHYQWKDEWRDQGIQSGLLAQEVEKVMPELVSEVEKGNKSVNYNGLIPYLLEAVKALNEENKMMRKEIQQLKKN